MTFLMLPPIKDTLVRLYPTTKLGQLRENFGEVKSPHGYDPRNRYGPGYAGFGNGGDIAFPAGEADKRFYIGSAFDDPRNHNIVHYLAYETKKGGIVRGRWIIPLSIVDTSDKRKESKLHLQGPMINLLRYLGFEIIGPLPNGSKGILERSVGYACYAKRGMPVATHFVYWFSREDGSAIDVQWLSISKVQWSATDKNYHYPRIGSPYPITQYEQTRCKRHSFR